MGLKVVHFSLTFLRKSFAFAFSSNYSRTLKSLALFLSRMKKPKPGLLFLSIFVVVVAAASSHSQSGPYLSHAPRGPISGGARLTSRDRPEVGNDAANAQQQKRRRCYFRRN